MAIDTVGKRFSALHIGCPWRGVCVLPDGAIDQGDRQAAAYLYAGILLPAVVVFVGKILTFQRRAHIAVFRRPEPLLALRRDNDA